MLRSAKRAVPFAFMGAVVVLVVAGVWLIDAPTYHPSEFYAQPLPEPGGTYRVVRSFVATPKIEDLPFTMAPHSRQFPGDVESMIEDGEAIRLQPGEVFRLLETRVIEQATGGARARIETRQGEAWTLATYLSAKEVCEPLGSANYAAATSEP